MLNLVFYSNATWKKETDGIPNLIDNNKKKEKSPKQLLMLQFDFLLHSIMTKTCIKHGFVQIAVKTQKKNLINFNFNMTSF